MIFCSPCPVVWVEEEREFEATLIDFLSKFFKRHQFKFLPFGVADESFMQTMQRAKLF